MKLYAVVLCGGGGSRLWPASRPTSPKQFIPLLGEQSLFEATIDRIGELSADTKLVVVTNENYLGYVSTQLGDREAQILLEPEARDSGPAMASAAAYIEQLDPDGVCVFLASDHYIPDHQAFAATVMAAAQTAGREHTIVTLGITPTHPSSAYGYIQPSQPASGLRVVPVTRFVEKPEQDVAREYIQEGYLWNSGNFICRADVLLEEIGQFQPEMLAIARAAASNCERVPGGLLFGERFKVAPKVSIDYAVMEPTAKAAVISCGFEWSDLGSWDAIHALNDEHIDGSNSKSGDVVLIETSNSLVRAGRGTFVATLGIQDVAVIADRGAVLVTRMEKAQDVKQVVSHLPAAVQQRLNQTSPLPIDLRSWSRHFRSWFFAYALPHWATLGRDEQNWGFHEALTRDGFAIRKDRRARVQGRQVFSFAVAGELGWPGPWRRLVSEGLTDFLFRYLREDGLVRTLVSVEGQVVDDRAYVYDQAFALLALAKAAPFVPHGHDRAEGIVTQLQNRRRHVHGGFVEEGEQPYQSNPHMHLLEAFLEWHLATGAQAWLHRAEEIIELALDRFIDPVGGFIREYFDENWDPAADGVGHIIEPGHQFEWSWLLGRYGDITGNQEVISAARRLFSAGIRGIDPVRKVAVDALDDEFEVANGRARLWPQTEYLKAAILLARIDRSNREDYRRHARVACHALQTFLDTEISGLWHDKLLEDGTFAVEDVTASSFYHIAGAVKQLSAAYPGSN